MRRRTGLVRRTWSWTPGPWIFGKKVLLPASVIQRIDLDAKKVHLDLTKDQIKSAPEFDEKTYASKEYRDRIGTY